MADSSAELLAALVARIASYPEGLTPTCVPFLQVVRRSRPMSVTHGALLPSFCLIVQGRKRLQIGARTLEYGPGEFIAALIDVPASGQVRAASRAKPYFGLRIDLTSADVAQVVAEANLARTATAAEPGATAFVGRADTQLLALHMRLLELLDCPHEAAFLGALRKRELVYRLLTGKQGPLFLQKVLFEPRAQGVAAAIAWIRDNYARSFTMESLARAHGFSVSGLHHKFKAVTHLSPLQYQKQLRLQEARRLLIDGSANATTAALAVGYESPSQFSREYRRYFGLPPRADAAAIRHSGTGVDAD